MDSFNLSDWLNEFLNKLNMLFGARIHFVGIQGSYGRGEQHEGSDIDIVVILERVEAADLRAYSDLLDQLPAREKVCGFISGYQELYGWERSDLFQFCYDTKPLQGDLSGLKERISEADITRAVRIGACNIYHGCAHNILHEKDPNILRALYKSAPFVIQAIHFLRSGEYIEKQKELVPILKQPEKEILETCMLLKAQPDQAKTALDQYAQDLLDWVSRLIIEYGEA